MFDITVDWTKLWWHRDSSKTNTWCFGI